MSYALGLSMTEDLLSDKAEEGPITEADIREALLEDFEESELKNVCSNWLSEYGCRSEWKEMVRNIANNG